MAKASTRVCFFMISSSFLPPLGNPSVLDEQPLDVRQAARLEQRQP